MRRSSRRISSPRVGSGAERSRTAVRSASPASSKTFAIVRRRHVGLEEQDHDLVRVLVEELADVAERVGHLRRPELADGVTEEDLALSAALRAHPEVAGEPLGRREHGRRQPLRHPVALASLGLEVGPHAALRIGDPPMRVEEQQADAVVELAGDVVALVGDEPAWRVGGGERVVSAGEDDLVEPQVAEVGRAVAAVGEAGARAFSRAGARGDDQHRDRHGGDPGHGDRGRPDQAAPATSGAGAPRRGSAATAAARRFRSRRGRPRPAGRRR